jgi:uncharacterized membrane protein HdeD (DUF308 family)
MGSIKLIRTAKTGYLVLAALFCIMGIAMLVLPNISLDVIGWGSGAIIAAFGIVRIIGHYSRDPYGLAFQHDPVLGILAIALGSVLMLRRSTAVNALGLVLGVELLADNLFKVQTAMEARRFGLGTWWLLLALAVIAVIAGTLLIVCPFEGMQAWVRVMGIALLSQGVMSFCMALCAIRIPPQRALDIAA